MCATHGIQRVYIIMLVVICTLHTTKVKYYKSTGTNIIYETYLCGLLLASTIGHASSNNY